MQGSDSERIAALEAALLDLLRRMQEVEAVAMHERRKAKIEQENAQAAYRKMA